MKRTRSSSSTSNATKQDASPLVGLIRDMKTTLVNLLPYPALSSLAQTCKHFAAFLTGPAGRLFVPWRWRKSIGINGKKFALLHGLLHKTHFFAQLGSHVNMLRFKIRPGLMQVDFILETNSSMSSLSDEYMEFRVFGGDPDYVYTEENIATVKTFVTGVFTHISDKRAIQLLEHDAEYAQLKEAADEAWTEYEDKNARVTKLKRRFDKSFDSHVPTDLVAIATELAAAMRASTAYYDTADAARDAAELYRTTVIDEMRKDSGL